MPANAETPAPKEASIEISPYTFHIEDHLKYTPEGAYLAETIAQLRKEIERQSTNKHASQIEGRCPASNKPFAAKNWTLLLSKNPEDHIKFYNMLGLHIGLKESYDAENPYHRRVLRARKELEALYNSYSSEELERLFNIALAKELNDPQTTLAELGQITLTDLIHIQLENNHKAGEIITQKLVPRAKLTVQMLEDLRDICTATPNEDQEASKRANFYMDPQNWASKQ